MNTTKDMTEIRRQDRSKRINCFLPNSLGNSLYSSINLQNKMTPYSISAKKTKKMQTIIQVIKFVVPMDFGDLEIILM